MFLKSEIASHDVDPQKGFTPICPDELAVLGGDKIASSLNEQSKYASIRTLSKDSHNRNAIWVTDNISQQLSPVEGDNVDVKWLSHCNVGEKGFEILDGLPKVTDYNFVVWKGIELDIHPYGSCYHDLHDKLSTGLIEFYKCNNIKLVIVGGLATDFCVKLTALQLCKHFSVIVNLESCRGIDNKTINEAIEEMKKNSIEIINKTKELSNFIDVK